MDRRNVKITSATLELHGKSLTSVVTVVDGGGVSQGFGGLRLMAPGMADYAGTWIWGLLDTLEVSSWDELAGVHVRVESETLGSPILRIGHILKDRWFDARGLPNSKPAEV